MRFLLSLLLILSIGISPVILYGAQDTDGDTIPDQEEDVNQNGVQDAGETDALNVDSDRGGESDGSEKQAKRNPLDQTDDLTFDADTDGWVNGIELLRGTNPKEKDTDGDGVMDSKDPFPLDSKYKEDANTNGLPDEWEKETTLNNQLLPQTRADDPDNDGLTNAEELAKGTNPVNADTDKDGVNDLHEIFEGGDPKENACLEITNDASPFPDTLNHWSKAIGYIGRMMRTRNDGMPFVEGRIQGIQKLFMPEAPMTRAEFAKLVLNSACIPLLSSSTLSTVQAKDLPIVASQSKDEELMRIRLLTAKALHIIEGYEDGSLRPHQTITRAEAITMVFRAHSLTMGSEFSTSPFTDVPLDAWFKEAVLEGWSREIVKGYTDGTFKPEKAISRAEGLAIILRAMRQNPTINSYIIPSEEEVESGVLQ